MIITYYEYYRLSLGFNHLERKKRKTFKKQKMSPIFALFPIMFSLYLLFLCILNDFRNFLLSLPPKYGIKYSLVPHSYHLSLVQYIVFKRL